jgi:hypothetical protein
MFICTDQLDDEKQKVEVYVDDDRQYPITLKIKIGGYATRVMMSRNDALDIMSQLEKAVHETAEKETL